MVILSIMMGVLALVSVVFGYWFSHSKDDVPDAEFNNRRYNLGIIIGFGGVFFFENMAFFILAKHFHKI